MNTPRNGSRMRALSAVALTLAVVVPVQAKEVQPSLVSAVPNDVFVCMSAKHNPEQEFLEKYWAEVTAEFQRSGVLSDVMGLLNGVQSDEQKAEVERVKGLVTKLIDGVDWKALGGGEIVFSERLLPPGPNVTRVVGVPDLVVMLRGSGDVAEKNYEGLVAILQTLGTEINKAAGQDVFVVEKSTRGKAQIASANLMRAVPNAPQMPLAVSRYGDTIIISFGTSMLNDVLGLLDGSSSKTSLAKTERYTKAMAALPTPENESVFVDVDRLMRFVHGMMDFAMAQGGHGGGDVMLNTGKNAEAKALADKAIAAYGQKDYAKALELTQKAYEKDKTDSRVLYNLACFNALEGHKQKALTWLDQAVDAGFYSPGQIQADSDLVSLHDDPAFKKSVDKARKLAKQSDSGDAEQWKQFAERVADLPGMIDYVASSSHTEGYSVYKDEVTVLKSGASKRAIYPVFAGRKPVADYDKYLPKETVSFAVGAGIDWTALYDFIGNIVKDVDVDGQSAWAMWEGIQQRMGLDVRHDIIGWIRGDYAQVSMKTAMGEQSVMMLGVKDEDLARKQLDTALAHVMKIMPELAKKNPAMAMMGIRSTPTNRDSLPGFHNIYFGMMPQPVVCGVIDQHLVFASSADAVELCLATAQGKHPSVRDNETVMAEMIHTKRPAQMVSFTDQRNTGNELAQVLGMVGVFGGMAGMAIPDPDAQKVLTSVLKIVAKLGPVAQKIDFFKSTSYAVTFDGQTWHKQSVTNYRSPKERLAERQ